MIELLLIFGALCLLNGIIFGSFMYVMYRAGADFDDGTDAAGEKK